MPGLAIITEACIDVKDRACVDVCPVQCIYEFDAQNNVLFSEFEAGSGITETIHAPHAGAIALFGDSVLYVPRSQGGAGVVPAAFSRHGQR